MAFSCAESLQLRHFVIGTLNQLFLRRSYTPIKVIL